MGNGVSGLKRGMEPEVQLTLTPQLSPYDTAFTEGVAAMGGIKAGFCPMCDLEARLYPPPASIIANSLRTGVTTLASRVAVGKHVCTLCEIAVNPEARAVAIYAGFIWYLIGKPDSENQSNINRTLWLAAHQTWGGFREASRAALRATLATQPPERGFDQAVSILGGAERSAADDAIKEAIGIYGLQGADDNRRRALVGTLGMHEVLNRVEAGGPRPEWLGCERYFLTGAGLKRLSREAHTLLHPGNDPNERFPLGHPAPGEQRIGPRNL